MPAEEHEPLLGPPGPSSQQSGIRSAISRSRVVAQRYVGTKWGHYSVIFLVTVDIVCIFANFMISLYLCEHECKQPESRYEGLHQAQEGLEIASLVISCLFMVELLLNFWALGIGYLKSWFHCLDAIVILAGFILDVCLKGVLQEVGTTIVVLRLWRVFQIVEEFSAGAGERMDPLYEQIEELSAHNRRLQEELRSAKAGQGESR